MQLRTRQMITVATVALGFIAALTGAARAQGNPSLGTWKLNVAKSKYEPGPAPTNEVRVYDAWEKDGIQSRQTRTRADGTTLTLGWAAHLDGKDYPYTGSPDYDSIAIKRVDANTTDSTQKKAGKVIVTTRTVISSDGKTRTITTKGTNAKGQMVNNVAVYDKQ